jgi:hypothetical protein
MSFELGSSQKAPAEFVMESAVLPNATSFAEPDAAFNGEKRDEQTKESESQDEQVSWEKKEVTARRDQRIKELEGEGLGSRMLVNNGGGSTADTTLEHFGEDLRKTSDHKRRHPVDENFGNQRYHLEETEKLRLQLADAKHKMSSADDRSEQLAELREELRETKLEVQSKRNEIDSMTQNVVIPLENDLLDSNNKRDALDEANKELKDQVARAKGFLKDMVDERDAALVRVNELETGTNNYTEELETKVAELNEQVEAKDEVIDALNKSNTQYEKDLEAYNSVPVESNRNSVYNVRNLEGMKEEWTAESHAIIQRQKDEINVLKKKAATLVKEKNDEIKSREDLQEDYDNIMSQTKALRDETGRFNLDPMAYVAVPLPANAASLASELEGLDEGEEVDETEYAERGTQTEAEEKRKYAERETQTEVVEPTTQIEVEEDRPYTEATTETDAVQENVIVVPGTPDTVIVYDTIHASRQSTIRHIAEVNVDGWKYFAHSIFAGVKKLNLPEFQSGLPGMPTLVDNDQIDSPTNAAADVELPASPADTRESDIATSAGPQSDPRPTTESTGPASNDSARPSTSSSSPPNTSLLHQLLHPLSHPKPAAYPLFFNLIIQFTILYFLYCCYLVLQEKHIWMAANNITRRYVSDIYFARHGYGRGGVASNGIVRRFVMPLFLEIMGIKTRGYAVPG